MARSARLVMNLVPNDVVVRASRSGRSDGERQTTFPSNDQQLQNESSFGVIRQESLPRKSLGVKPLSGMWMFVSLNTLRDAIFNDDGSFGVGESTDVIDRGIRLIDHVTGRAVALPHAVVTLTRRTTKMIAGIHHRLQAAIMKRVLAFGQSADGSVVAEARIARQLLHADVAVVVGQVGSYSFRRDGRREQLHEILSGRGGRCTDTDDVVDLDGLLRRSWMTETPGVIVSVGG